MWLDPRIAGQAPPKPRPSHSVIDVQNHVLREVVQLKAGMELFGYTCQGMPLMW